MNKLFIVSLFALTFAAVSPLFSNNEKKEVTEEETQVETPSTTEVAQVEESK